MTVPGTIEAAGEEDLDAVLAIERASTPTPWTIEHFREEAMDTPDRRLLLFRTFPREPLPRGIAGYAAVRRIVDELHLHNLAVHPAFRRRGIGRRLLEEVLGLALGRGARVVLLEVREGNTAARALYATRGFRVLSSRKAYYRDPVEDGVVMSLQLSSTESS